MNVFLALRNFLVRLLRKRPDYVWIEVRGDLPELSHKPGLLRRRLSPGPVPPSLEEIRAQLRSLQGNAGVLLRVGDLGLGWAPLEELRREISGFRERGGRVVAYVTWADSRSYYLACAADEILATPLATIGVTGVRTRVSFLKDALEHLGVEAEVLAVSPYKSAGDVFTRNDFSKEAREQAERLLEGRYGELVRAVSEGRGITPEEAKEKIDRAPYGATEAVEEGLLDGVCYEDELPERLGSEGRRARIAGWGAARRSFPRPYRSLRRRVGVVELTGTIVRGRSRRLPVPLPFFGGEQAGSESVVGALRAAERSRRVAAVLFHVDSGGGDALASDLIWREVERIRRKKPVVVLMGSAAASGGYYVSAAANYIVARRTTLTGSIGVFLTRPVAAGLYRKLGVNPVSIERGARAGLLDESRRPTEDEIRVLEEQLRQTYGEFKDRVMRGRNLDRQALEEIAGGRVWSGAEALDLGLVDEVGGFEEALRRAAELGGLGGVSLQDVVKVAPPKGRPAPGELVQGAEDLKLAFSELRLPNVWAALPYDLREGW